MTDKQQPRPEDRPKRAGQSLDKEQSAKAGEKQRSPAEQARIDNELTQKGAP
jgi:hypothetical protein